MCYLTKSARLAPASDYQDGLLLTSKWYISSATKAKRALLKSFLCYTRLRELTRGLLQYQPRGQLTQHCIALEQL